MSFDKHDPDRPRKYTWESGQGRLDEDGVEWFACDPYPTWYRWAAHRLIPRSTASSAADWAGEF